MDCAGDGTCVDARLMRVSDMKVGGHACLRTAASLLGRDGGGGQSSNCIARYRRMT